MTSFSFESLPWIYLTASTHLHIFYRSAWNDYCLSREC